jgi:hypothetical protein
MRLQIEKSGPLSASPSGPLALGAAHTGVAGTGTRAIPLGSGPDNWLRPAVDSEFAADTAGVGLDRAQREEKPGSGGLIGMVLSKTADQRAPPFRSRQQLDRSQIIQRWLRARHTIPVQ